MSRDPKSDGVNGDARERLRALVAATFADASKPYTVDDVAAELKIHRDQVNELAPWDRAELDPSNSDVYRVELEGDPVEWEFRDSPDYYDGEGRRRDADADVLNDEHAPKLVKPAYARVDLRARSKAEAETAALATHPGFHTVISLKIAE